MLLKLIRKDFILHWRAMVALPIAVVGLLIYAVLRDPEDLDPGFFAVMVSLMAGFVPVTVAAREDKMKSKALTCSLPVSRASAVVARYMGSWVVSVAFAALTALVLLALRGPASLREVFRLPTVFTMLTVTTLCLGLMLPFVERFGFVGVLALLIALQLLGLLAVVTSSALPGRLGIPAVVGAVRSFASSSRTRLGLPAYYGLFALALALVNAGSLALSIALFRRREL